MQKSLDALAKEILTIRTGRASPALVDKIPVEYYGNPTPLNQLATITVPEARMIIIQPWDRTIIGAVEKAIQKSELGLNPGNDGQLIRVPIPPLNEERRREYARLVKRYAEGAHVAIRNIRREQIDRIKALEKEKKISADEARRGGDQLRKVAELSRRGIELRFSGRLQELSSALQDQMRQASERTRVNARAILNIAINYGGRQEIIDAIRELAREGTDLSKLEDATLASHLYTRGLPDPDLLVRTAGEMRLSNFLLWQTAYSEFYSTQTLWPDFADADFDEAIASYQRRVRRFGARPEEVPHRGR